MNNSTSQLINYILDLKTSLNELNSNKKGIQQQIGNTDLELGLKLLELKLFLKENKVITFNEKRYSFHPRNKKKKPTQFFSIVFFVIFSYHKWGSLFGQTSIFKFESKEASKKINNAVVWRIFDRILPEKDKSLLIQIPPKRLESVRSMIVGGKKDRFLFSLDSILNDFERDVTESNHLCAIWTCAVELANRKKKHGKKVLVVPTKLDFKQAVEEESEK